MCACVRYLSNLNTSEHKGASDDDEGTENDEDEEWKNDDDDDDDSKREDDDDGESKREDDNDGDSKREDDDDDESEVVVVDDDDGESKGVVVDDDDGDDDDESKVVVVDDDDDDDSKKDDDDDDDKKNQFESRGSAFADFNLNELDGRFSEGKESKYTAGGDAKESAPSSTTVNSGGSGSRMRPSDRKSMKCCCVRVSVCFMCVFISQERAFRRRPRRFYSMRLVAISRCAVCFSCSQHNAFHHLCVRRSPTVTRATRSARS